MIIEIEHVTPHTERRMQHDKEMKTDGGWILFPFIESVCNAFDVFDMPNF